MIDPWGVDAAFEARAERRCEFGIVEGIVAAVTAAVGADVGVGLGAAGLAAAGDVGAAVGAADIGGAALLGGGGVGILGGAAEIAGSGAPLLGGAADVAGTGASLLGGGGVGILGGSADIVGGGAAAAGITGGAEAAGGGGALLGPGVSGFTDATNVAGIPGVNTALTPTSVGGPGATVSGFGSAAPGAGPGAVASAPAAAPGALATDPGSALLGGATDTTTAGATTPSATASNLGVGGGTFTAPADTPGLAPGLSQTPGGVAPAGTGGGIPGSPGAGIVSPVGTTPIAPSTPAADAAAWGNAAPAADSSGGILKTLGLTPMQAVGSGVSALMLGQSLLGNNTATAFPGGPELTGQAANLSAQGQQLQSYLQSGALPPGAQAGIDQAVSAAKARIMSVHASQGTTGSTMEAQDLANVDQQAAAMGFNMAAQLFSQGLSETQISEQIYQSLLSTNITLNQQVGQGVANLATALGGGVRLNLGGTGGTPVNVTA